jgi:hypothetical protein
VCCLAVAKAPQTLRHPIGKDKIQGQACVRRQLSAVVVRRLLTPWATSRWLTQALCSYAMAAPVSSRPTSHTDCQRRAQNDFSRCYLPFDCADTTLCVAGIRRPRSQHQVLRRRDTHREHPFESCDWNCQRLNLDRCSRHAMNAPMTTCYHELSHAPHALESHQCTAAPQPGDVGLSYGRRASTQHTAESRGALQTWRK